MNAITEDPTDTLLSAGSFKFSYPIEGISGVSPRY